MKFLKLHILILSFIILIIIGTLLTGTADNHLSQTTGEPQQIWKHTPFIEKNKALIPAIREKDAKKVHALLENGANPNMKAAYDATPLYIAMVIDSIGIARELIRYGADVNGLVPNRFEDTLIMNAVRNNKPDFVELFIENGADINSPNRKGNLPIIIAASTGNRKIVQLLLNNGADPTIQATIGLNPLSAAKANGHREIVELLIDAGAVAE